jgi:hypothetical protein
VVKYNVRVLQYPNGEVVLRRYSEFIVNDDISDYEDAAFNDDDYFLPEKGKGKIKNPFDNKIVLSEFDDLEELEKRKFEYEMHSFNRTKGKIYDYSRCCKWEWFVTFTFSSEVIDRYDYDACSKVLRKWLNNQKRNAPNLKYLVVPEMHTGETYIKKGIPLPKDYKPGAFHFHGLFADTGNMKFVESGNFTDDGDMIYNMSKWSKGWSTATKVKDIYKSSKYLSKYITKSLCDCTKGRHRYFVSTNIDKPNKYLFCVSDDSDFEDLQEYICGSFGVELQYVSTPRTEGAYMDVDYYTYCEV